MNNKTTSNGAATLLDTLRVLPQYLLPQHWLTGIVYRVTRCTWKPFKNSLIRCFIRVFRVDMTCAQQEHPGDYPHFNAFFTRPLKPGLRPVATDLDAIVSPVDGTVSQSGQIEENRLLQAKGYTYTLEDLLVEDQQTGAAFRGGHFITLYLAPRDYHRIHMPCDARLTTMTYVPGKLFAVNQHTSRVVDRLFARNERVILRFETAHGPMALVMVGAIFVGSMETTWAGAVTPSRDRNINTAAYPDKPGLARGTEMGRFNMGSTVILLFPENSMQWEAGMIAGKAVLVGETLGRFNH